MFLFHLCTFAACYQWNFTDRNAGKFLERSEDAPVITLFVSGDCPRCSDAVSVFARANTFRSSIEVGYSVINCSQTSFCSAHGIDSFPSAIVVQGEDERYWRPITNITISSLKTTAIGIMHLKVTQVKTKADIYKYQLQYNGGGSHFHLALPHNSKAMLNRYIGIARSFSRYNCTFTYSFERTASSIIYSFQYPNCTKSARTNPLEIQSFIKTNRFSASHVYSRDEFINQIKMTSMIISIYNTTDDIFDIHSDPSMCSKYNIAFFNYNQNADLLQSLGVNITSIPTTIGINSQNGCYVEGKVSDAFIHDLETGSNCVKLTTSPQKKKAKFPLSILVAIIMTVLFIRRVSRD